MCISDCPTVEDDKRRIPLSGKAGQELAEHYLAIAGLTRAKVHITSAVKCLPDSTNGKLDLGREKDLNLLYSCTEHNLYREIREVKPQILVPMGPLACHAIDPEINLELHHGIPLQTSWGTTFPMYSPGGGIHEPKKMLQIRTDWLRFAAYRKGKLRVAADPYPNPDYQQCDARGVREYLGGCEGLPLACDTETYRSRNPFCITFSTAPGTGRLISADDSATLAELQKHLDRWQAEILWHNWLFDYPITRAMGLTFPRRRIVDTMVRVFHLGNIPQGLKALAFRELGMTMQDFDDLVTPHSRELVLDYYHMAQNFTWPKPDEQVIRDKNGSLKLYKPQGFNTKLKRFFTDLTKNQSKDVFDMWEKNWTELHEQVEEKLGPWPGKCISYVPFEDALYYACRDADALIRLWPIIKTAISRMRKVSQELWTGSLAA